jgi:uncharacterized protein YndB with AHSA1/START domain
MQEPMKLPDQVLSIDIGVPVERVWREITKTGTIQRAVNNTVLESSLTPGSKLRYYSPSKKRVFVVGEVVEVAPPRRFSHTWKFTMSPDDPTLVTWELAAIPGGCRVTLTHSRWTDRAKSYKSVGKTWAEILRVLKVELESGDIPFKTKLLYRVFGALEFMLPKSTTIEHVTHAGW